LPTSDTDCSASDSSCTEARLPAARRRAYRAALALWAIAACFNGLGDGPVFIANEAREGVYARAMLSSGHFVAPLVANHLENGESVPDKPPLAHWLAAAAAWAKASFAAGEPVSAAQAAVAFDEWTLRFPSALCACLLVVSIAILGAPLVGERAALFGAAAALTSAQFWYQARLGRVDMPLACFTTIAALLAGRAMLEGSASLLLGAAVAAGLAVLAKGPLGVLLPALACAAFAVLRRRSYGAAPAAALPWRAAAAIVGVLVVPWYAAAIASSGGATLRSQLFAENLDQFTGANGRMAAAFYLWPWFLDSVPWNLVALAALPWVWKRREPGVVFCAAWWLVVLAFFEIAAYKRRAYLLPALPAEALLAGWLVDRASSARSALPGLSVDRRRILASSWIALAAVYAAIAPVGLARFAERVSPKPFIRQVDETLPAADRLRVCGIGFDPSLVLLFYFRDPERVDVASDEASCVAAPSRFYLLSQTEWRRMLRSNDAAPWTELLRGEIRGWTKRIPVTLARRGETSPEAAYQTANAAGPLPR
jgi:4-amino-4-deoxy-L-arabinose transferase-like glycosyltransferase